MKAEVIPSGTFPRYAVRISEGCQSFRLEYLGTKTECSWYARMFRIALRKHDAVQKGASRATER